MPIALDHAERDNGNQQNENQAHVLVPPISRRQISRMRGKQKEPSAGELALAKERIAIELRCCTASKTPGPGR
jgi:hypothetical protein